MIGDRKKPDGVTLLEMLVSVGIFVTIMLMVTGIVTGVSQEQRSAWAAQDSDESLRYIMEVVSKEMRQALRSDNSCDLGTAAIYRVYNSGNTGIPGADSDYLYFQNKLGECVYYYLDNGRLMVRRDSVAYEVTPRNITVNTFNFLISDNEIGTLPQFRIQPRVTISLTAEANIARENERQELRVQTTISSRFYE